MDKKENTDGHVAQPSSYAAGFKGVLVASQHVFAAMPVARGIKSLLKLNQKNGIDCPSCAWPDPDGHRSAIGEFCENGAKAIADEATTRKIGLPFFQNYSVAQLTEKSDFWLGQQGRLCEPMVIKPGDTHYQPISWQQAFELIAKELNSLSHPNEAVFYTSGRSSNEAAYLYQLFVRAFGTNNLPDCSNMCHESSGVALHQTIGIGKGTVTLADFEKAELIIIMGQNPGTNHPRMLSSLEAAKNNGAKIVSINPLLEPGLLAFRNPQKLTGYFGQASHVTDLYLQLKINSDLALLKAANALLIKKAAQVPQVIDADFIEKKTEGYAAFKEVLEKIDIHELITETGLSPAQVQEFVELLAQSKKIIICWAMGLTQHQNAVATIREAVNLVLLKGAIGKEGAGLCPVRGHSNVQGDRSVGIMHKTSEKLNEALQNRYKFSPPTQSGYDVTEAIHALYNKQAKVLIALGGNLLSAAPDTTYSSQAFKNCRLTVQISTKLNRSHLHHGQIGLILPCLGRTDIDTQGGQQQYVSTENSMGVVQKSMGVLQPVSENLMSEPAIVARMAAHTLGDKVADIPWTKFENDYSLIRAEIAAVIKDFENYEQRLAQDGGFYLENGPRIGQFQSKNSKAQFSVNSWTPQQLAPGALLMMTIRSHDQFNTTVYGLNDRYRGIFNERKVLFINQKDMDERGLKAYEKVTLASYRHGTKRLAADFKIVPYNIPQGCVASYFPEANVLVPIGMQAHESGTPVSKSVEIFIEKNEN